MGYGNPKFQKNGDAYEASESGAGSAGTGQILTLKPRKGLPNFPRQALCDKY